MMHYHALAVLLLVALLGSATAVDKHKFRTCDMTGFCKRHRHKVPQVQYHVNPATVKGLEGKQPVTATLAGGAVPLELQVTFLGSGIARARITDPAKPRWEVPDVIEPLGAAPHTILPESHALAPGGSHGVAIAFGEAGEHQSVLVITFAPLKLELFINGELALSANSRNLFHFEHHRSPDGAPRQLAEAMEEKKEPENGKKIVDYDEHGRAIYEDGTTSEEENVEAEDAPPPPVDTDCHECWEEKFQSHTDTKPLGPASVGMDINFHGAAHVMGIPEHATQMALKPTTGSGDWAEPYRMYTLDVFEYELDVPMALYGDIPLMIGHDAKKTVGAFWHNPSETFIDVRLRLPKLVVVAGAWSCMCIMCPVSYWLCPLLFRRCDAATGWPVWWTSNRHTLDQRIGYRGSDAAHWPNCTGHVAAVGVPYGLHRASPAVLPGLPSVPLEL